MEQNQIKTDGFIISLNLTAAEVNAVLASLGAQPHDAVRMVIDNILSQATPQFQAQLEVAVAEQGAPEEVAAE